MTVLGKKMASFPIDPKYSKVLLSAPEFNCLDEVCLILKTNDITTKVNMPFVIRFVSYRL